MEDTKISKDLIINTIMNNSQDTIYIKDKNSAIIWSSKAHANLWGVEDPTEVIGKTDYDYFPKNFADIAFKEEQNIMKTGISISSRVERLVKPNGEIMWLSSYKYPFYNEEGEIIGIWGTSRDITALKETEQELIRVNEELEDANSMLQIISAKDSLSGLYNRRFFHSELEKTFRLYTRQREKDRSKDFALILIDIDSFKEINDAYGHLMGDFAIQHLSDLMMKNVRASDTCFRYGGDEFAILLLDTDISGAVEIARKLRCIIEHAHISHKDENIKMTTSMGVASFTESRDPEDLIHQADSKLYLSKNSGKNTVC